MNVKYTPLSNRTDPRPFEAGDWVRSVLPDSLIKGKLGLIERVDGKNLYIYYGPNNSLIGSPHAWERASPEKGEWWKFTGPEVGGQPFRFHGEVDFDLEVHGIDKRQCPCMQCCEAIARAQVGACVPVNYGNGETVDGLV